MRAARCPLASRATRLQFRIASRPSGVANRFLACGSAWNVAGDVSLQNGRATSASTIASASARCPAGRAGVSGVLQPRIPPWRWPARPRRARGAGSRRWANARRVGQPPASSPARRPNGSRSAARSGRGRTSRGSRGWAGPGAPTAPPGTSPARARSPALPGARDRDGHAPLRQHQRRVREADGRGRVPAEQGAQVGERGRGRQRLQPCSCRRRSGARRQSRAITWPSLWSVGQRRMTATARSASGVSAGRRNCSPRISASRWPERKPPRTSGR